MSPGTVTWVSGPSFELVQNWNEPGKMTGSKNKLSNARLSGLHLAFLLLVVVADTFLGTCLRAAATLPMPSLLGDICALQPWPQLQWHRQDEEREQRPCGSRVPQAVAVALDFTRTLFKVWCASIDLLKPVEWVRVGSSNVS